MLSFFLMHPERLDIGLKGWAPNVVVPPTDNISANFRTRRVSVPARTLQYIESKPESLNSGRSCLAVPMSLEHQ